MQIKSILVTGCSSGIGYRVAHDLADRGYRVFATARHHNDVEKLSREGLNSLRLDISDSSSIRTTVETILDQTDGKLDALFNNAGYGQPGAVEDLTRDVIREQFETNLFGTMELTNKIIPVMRQQGHGRIISNSSVLGFIALPYRGAYNASKFALEGLTDTLRLELHRSGIHVSLIEPGPIVSKFRDNAFSAYKKHIDARASAHRDTYAGLEKRLNNQGFSTPFSLPADAITKKVLHALESRSPKNHYYVTFPTYLFAALKRTLPSAGLDWVLRLIGNKENR
ncbi:MAG: SDR family NAD(P)-dependent oxidoreductase [Gammaproteobacteria bacterium]